VTRAASPPPAAALSTQVPGASPEAGASRLRGVLRRYLGVGAALLLLVMVLSVTQEQFLTTSNLMNVLRTNAVLFVVAVGVTYVIISTGLDLSVGALTALGGVLLADMLTSGVPVVLAVVLTIVACGSLGGLINGGLIAFGGFNFFVVTLAMMQVFRAVALVMSDGTSTSTIDYPLVQEVGDGAVAGLSVPVLLAILIGLIAHAVLRYTRFGRSVYAVGGNEAAARLSGVSVTRIRFAVYAIAATCAGIAAVMLTGRLTSSQPNSAAVGLELSAAAAVLLGGASFAGGAGTIGGTAIGVLFLGFIANGITLAGVPSYWQGVATGTVLIFAIALDRLRRR